MAPEKYSQDELLDIFKAQTKRSDYGRFGPKISVINDLLFALRHSKQSQRDFSVIVKKHQLPLLDELGDSTMFEKNPSSTSRYWQSQGVRAEAAFDADVRKLIDSYALLPMILFPFVKSIIMYPDSSTEWVPWHDASFLQKAIKNRDDFKKLPLTTQEKSTLISMTRSAIGFGKMGRPKKSDEEMFALVSNLIRTSPSAHYRKSGVSMSDTARKIFLMREKRKSYRDIVQTLHPNAKDIDSRMEKAKRIDFEMRKRIAALTEKKSKNK